MIIISAGSPDQPRVTSSPAGGYMETYKLVWRVWTPAQASILNQSILYRRLRKVSNKHSSIRPSIIIFADKRPNIKFNYLVQTPIWRIVS